MANTVKLKRSSVQGKVPLVSDLQLGELAVNTYDGKIYLKKNVGGTESIVDVSLGLSATEILTLLKTVDGAGSGLDADLLDGLTSIDFARSGANSDITSLSGVTGGISTADFVDFDLTAAPTVQRGRVWYNSEDDTLNIAHDNGIVQQVGQEFYLPPCKNSSGTTIANGQLVMATGAIGDKITIAKAVTNGTVEPEYMIGVATHNISLDNEFAMIVTDGIVRGIDTSTWTIGTLLYPDPTSPGNLTSTKPQSPAIKTPIAIVLRQHAITGRIYVRMSYGSKLGGTDSNVEFTTLANNDIIVYNSTNSRWENKQLTLGTHTTGNYVASITNGSYITGGNGGSESAAITLAVDATSANTASKVVARDASGNFSAGTVTATLSGNASTATKLQTARTINGTSFDGSANITVTANTTNSQTIKFDTGVTEGTDLYTFNGSAAKTLDIKAGTNVTLTKAAGSITISANDTSVDWSEIQNKPDPTVTVTLTGDVTGTANTTLTDLASGTISVATTIAANSVALGTDTTGNYVASVATTAPLSGGAAGSEGSTLTLSLASGYGDTQNPYASKTANTVLAAPNGSAGVPSFRALVAQDIPTLDASKITSGVFDAARLPSYVDDVLEYTNLASFPPTGETGKIYVDLATNKTYRWSGTVYVYITSGAVDSVAGKTGVVTLTNSDVGLGNVENKSSATIRSELTSTNVTTALGYTPYNSTNPNGYTTNTGTVTSITAGTGLSGGTITTSGTISLANTAVTAGSYTLANITVDAQGRITAASNGSASASISDAPPTAVNGTLWWDSRIGRLFVYYNDGTTSQWVDASPGTGPVGPQGPQGPQGATGPQGPQGLTGGVNGGTLTGQLIGATLSMSMSQDGGANNGSFVVRASGTGDANLAGITFHNDSYAIKMGIRADGYIGIGGWSRAAWSWYSDPSGNMVAAGSVTAYSDPRLKENFVKVENPLEILSKLDGGTFNWKRGYSHTECKAGSRDYGILADQVELVMPEIVTESIEIDGEKYKTVAYEKLIPVLIEAIKQQQKQIDSLMEMLND